MPKAIGDTNGRDIATLLTRTKLCVEGRKLSSKLACDALIGREQMQHVAIRGFLANARQSRQQ